MSFLLNGFYALLLILISPWVTWRALFQRRYRKGWGAKLLGTIPMPLETTTHSNSSPDPNQETIWLHAVSVGELQVIRPVVERFQLERPRSRLVITTSTDSGYELAKKLYSQHIVSFAPFDFSWAIKRALKTIQPTLVILAELELWPNWIRIAHDQGIPIAVVNARIGEKSFRGYQRFTWLFRPLFRKLTWVGCQTETYQERFRAVGCDAASTSLTGNIKFDGASSNRSDPEVIARRRLLRLNDGDLVWLVGSTQSPEEQFAIDAFQKLTKQYPQLRLLLVPRHAERFEEVAQWIANTGLAWTRRSVSKESVTVPDWKIFLADSVGELRWWWGLADIGFVGGSFGNRGGQNMIEPCAYGVATSFGPNTRNFTDIVRLLLENQAAVELHEPPELQTWTQSMIDDEAGRKDLAARAQQTVLAHRGAVDRTWLALKQILDDSPRSNGTA